MYKRDLPTTTVSDVIESMEKANGTDVRVKTSGIRFSASDRAFQFKGVDGKKEKDYEIAATEETITALSGWVDVPTKFVLRQDLDFQEVLLNHLLSKKDNEAVVHVEEARGITSVISPAHAGRVIDPRRIVEVASMAVHSDALVVDFCSDSTELRLDVIVPTDRGKFVGGDPKVGDITRGGLRFGQNRKANTAPWVQPYLYRLACTNGMELPETDLKVDARGQTGDEILAEINAKANIAMGRIERRIEEFYALRDEKVEQPEQTLYRMGTESKIADRMVNTLARTIPVLRETVGQDISMFDLVNHVTNLANEDSISRRFGSRRDLEMAGGTLVAQHVDRCANCRSTIH